MAAEVIEAGAEIVDLARDLAKDIADAVKSLDNAQHACEEQFTKAFIDKMRQMYPDKNAIIAHAPPHVNPNFSGVIIHDHVEIPLPGIFNQTQGYDFWVFDSGDFWRLGDPTFVNWCFAGNFTRGSGSDENHVHFDSVPPRETPAPPVVLQPQTTPDPIRSHPDGVYFVNCRRGDEISSGLAYYKNMNGDGGSGPNDYVDVVHGSFTTWERVGSAKYANGTVFHWNIYGPAQDLPDYSRVGICDNGYNNYAVYKDRQRVIYTVDGWECTTIYWCF